MPERMHALLCCLPDVPVPQASRYSTRLPRRRSCSSWTAYNFCVGGVKRSCIHFVTPNGQIIPFDTYNLFYRDGRIDGIRRRLDRASVVA